MVCKYLIVCSEIKMNYGWFINDGVTDVHLGSCTLNRRGTL